MEPERSIQKFQGFIFDLDGTVYLGEKLISGADDTILTLRNMGKKVVFLSNKPLYTREDYARKLTNMGVRVCLDGVSPESDRMVEELNTIKAKIFEAEIHRLKTDGLNESPHIQWLHVEDRFTPMGVKMIGAFCHTIKNMEFIDPKKYIAGFQDIPDEIPGFGPIAFNEVKISMRVPAFMEKEIKEEKAAALNTFLPEATNRLGGFSDACHRLAAATTLAIGKEDELIEEMEKIISV
jgi:hypothetical protein